MGLEGDLAHLADWGSKLAGLVVRISSLCHSVSCQAQGRLPWEQPIPAETISRSVMMADEFLIPHAKTVFAAMGADPEIEQARQVLRAALACPETTVSRRNLHQILRRTFPRPEMLDRPLEILTQYGYVRPIVTQPVQRQGRKPSPSFEINPLARTQNALNTQKGPNPRHFEDSVHSVYAPDPQILFPTNGHAADLAESEWLEMVV